jgi:hypothetical protein
VSVALKQEQTDGAVFEVDPHGVVSDQPDEPDSPQPDAQEAAVAQVVAMGWTPDEATALVCALWNLGILLYGPEWAADPRETIGWNITVAQMLDIYVPKGVGGAVQLGAGMLMIGNGIMMMAARRAPILRRGPRPLWQTQPAPDAPVSTGQPQGAPPPASKPANTGGRYEMPKDLVPPPRRDDSLNGIGL